MSLHISNQLKVVVFNLNVKDTYNVIRRDIGETVQNYNYDVFRTRNEKGLPYGQPHSSLLEVTVKNFSENFASFYYKGMHSNTPQEISLVFNAEYQADGRLKGYDEAVVVRGYIVEVTEAFSSEKGINFQRVLSVKILACRMEYCGTDASVAIQIIKD